MDQGNCIKFYVKNEIKCTTTFEMLIVAFRESTKSRRQVQLCYNWKAEKMAARAHQQPMKTLKQ